MIKDNRSHTAYARKIYITEELELHEQLEMPLTKRIPNWFIEYKRRME